MKKANKRISTNKIKIRNILLVALYLSTMIPLTANSYTNTKQSTPIQDKKYLKEAYYVPFEEREEIWLKRCSEAKKKGTPLPPITQKYSIDEITLLDIAQTQDEKKIAFFTNTIDNQTIEARETDEFWDGIILKIENTCAEIEDRRLDPVHQPKKIKLCIK